MGLIYTDWQYSHKNVIIIITIVAVMIIFIFLVKFIHGTCNYIPETNHVVRVYNVADVLYLQFMLHIMLFHMLNMFCTFTLVLSTVCVQCPIWLLFVVPYVFPVYYSGIFLMILR